MGVDVPGKVTGSSGLHGIAICTPDTYPECQKVTFLSILSII